MARFKLSFSALAVLGAFFVSPLALAQPGPGMMGNGYYGPGMMRGGGMMRGFDGNGDGAITREEFQSHMDSMFAVMDRDHSGTLTRDEFRSLHMGPGGAFGPWTRQQDARKAERFAEIDRNKDGMIDRDEFNAWEGGWFGRADPRGRGSVPLQRYRMMDRW